MDTKSKRESIKQWERKLPAIIAAKARLQLKKSRSVSDASVEREMKSEPSPKDDATIIISDNEELADSAQNSPVVNNDSEEVNPSKTKCVDVAQSTSNLDDYEERPLKIDFEDQVLSASSKTGESDERPPQPEEDIPVPFTVSVKPGKNSCILQIADLTLDASTDNCMYLLYQESESDSSNFKLEHDFTFSVPTKSGPNFKVMRFSRKYSQESDCVNGDVSNDNISKELQQAFSSFQQVNKKRKPTEKKTENQSKTPKIDVPGNSFAPTSELCQILLSNQPPLSLLHPSVSCDIARIVSSLTELISKSEPSRPILRRQQMSQRNNNSHLERPQPNPPRHFRFPSPPQLPPTTAQSTDLRNPTQQSPPYQIHLNPMPTETTGSLASPLPRPPRYDRPPPDKPAHYYHQFF